MDSTQEIKNKIQGIFDLHHCSKVETKNATTIANDLERVFGSQLRITGPEIAGKNVTDTTAIIIGKLGNPT